MTGKTIDLKFRGYWLEEDKLNVPAGSGIYCVYACTPIVKNGVTEVRIHELVYIGESADVRTRLTQHNRLDDWQKHLKKGDQLCYSFAPVTTGKDDRVRAEAALINKLTPPENSEYVGNYPYNQTTINTSGKTANLLSEFTVDQS